MKAQGISLTTALVALAAWSMAPLALADDLRAGASAVVITPAQGTPMAGYYFARAAEGVHDDLYAKALVIESGGAKAALVALDLISTTRDMVEEARREIEAATGIPGGSVMISATHAHTGPVLRGRGERDVALGGDTDPVVTFRKGLPGKIARAVQQADAALAPARLSVAHGEEATIAFNRRFHMKDGTVGWNPGKLNPRIVKPAGTIDPDVPLIFAETADGKTPIAAYVNYAVHLDNVGGPMISADMPYTLSKSLGEFLGPKAVTLFTAGCCGDINHVDVNWSAPQKGFENAARMGVILAGEVLRSWPRLAPFKPGALRFKSATVALDLPKVEPGDVEKAREIAQRHRSGDKTNAPKFLEQVWAYKTLDVAAREGKPQEVEVQVIALGDEVAWVSLPGEIFVELGLSVKQDSPFPHTVIAELANGAIGYVPSRRAYTQGNYEVVSARCAEGSGERLVDAAVKLLKDLHGEATAATRTAGNVGE
ncbi:MAG: hypothetical protein AB7I30_12905 [Isosphaeraceae bacterium]